MTKTYSEMCRFDSFEDRFKYLSLDGSVGVETFGFDRYFNQKFYSSREWKSLRDQIILRDSGCDLGVSGHEIFGRVIIHHLNPIMLNDIVHQTDFLMNPEFLVCTCHQTHNAIHYGDVDLLMREPIERHKNDTIPWR